MSPKNTVKANIVGMENGEANIAGGSIEQGNIAAPLASTIKGGNQIEITLKNIKGARINVAGDQIHQVQAMVVQMDELVGLLHAGLKSKDEQKDVEDMARQVLEEASKASSERNTTKLKRLLKDIGAYIGVASLAVSQAEQVKQLLEMVRGFLGI